MIALLITCLIIQGSVVINAGRSSPRSTFEIKSNRESTREFSSLETNDRKTHPSAKSYFVLDVGGLKGEDCSNVEHDVNTRTIILIEHQMKRKLNGDDSNGDDDGNSEDVNDDDDSDFEVGEDEINGYDDAVTFREDEEEYLRTKSQTKRVGTGGGGDDDDNDGADSAGDSQNDRVHRKSNFNNDDNRDNIDENDDPDFTDNEEETNNADDVRDTNNSNSISELKSLWRNAITASRIEQQRQNQEEVLKAINQQISENKSIAVTDIEAYHQMPLSTIMSQFPALLRANGTDSASFHRQLESQFLDPVAVGNNRAVWMDQEFALVLKGNKHTHTYMYTCYTINMTKEGGKERQGKR